MTNVLRDEGSTESSVSPAEVEVLRRERGRLGSYWWRWLLGGILLTSLVVVIGPKELWTTARQASPLWVFAAFAACSIYLVLGGLNVWILLRRLADVRLTTFLRIYVTSWAAGLLLPGQLGDVTQVILLRRHGVSTGCSSAAYVVDKVISLSWMLVVAAVGTALYLPRLRGEIWLFFVPIALIPIALVALRAIRVIIPDRHGILVRIRDWLDHLVDQLHSFRRFPKTLILNGTLTILKWVVMAVIFLAAFRAFGAQVPFVQASTIPVMSSLVGYIPITVGGAGTMEWTAVALFAPFDLEAATVVSAFLLTRLMLLVVGLGLVMTTGRLDAGSARTRTSTNGLNSEATHPSSSGPAQV